MSFSNFNTQHLLDVKIYFFIKLSSLRVGSSTDVCLIASCLDEGSQEQNLVRALMYLLHRFCVCSNPRGRASFTLYILFLLMVWKFAHLFVLATSFTLVNACTHGRWGGNALLRSSSHKEHGLD